MEKNKSMTIVLCSKGYPENYKNIQIKNLDKLNFQNDKIFMLEQDFTMDYFYQMVDVF